MVPRVLLALIPALSTALADFITVLATDARVTYSGSGWNPGTFGIDRPGLDPPGGGANDSSCAIGDSGPATRVLGSGFSFAFTGVQVKLVMESRADHGVYDVLLDGASTTVDGYSNLPQCGVAYTSDVLQQGNHTVAAVLLNRDPHSPWPNAYLQPLKILYDPGQPASSSVTSASSPSGTSPSLTTSPSLPALSSTQSQPTAAATPPSLGSSDTGTEPSSSTNALAASTAPTPATATAASPANTSSTHGLSRGAVLGLAIGVSLVVGAIVGILAFVWHRRRTRRPQMIQPEIAQAPRENRYTITPLTLVSAPEPTTSATLSSKGRGPSTTSASADGGPSASTGPATQYTDARSSVGVVVPVDEKEPPPQYSTA